MAELDIQDLKRRMHGALEALGREFAGLRTGRASISLLEPINVDAYGAAMPLNQVASISVPEPRMITVQVWDRALASTVEKAIREHVERYHPEFLERLSPEAFTQLAAANHARSKTLESTKRFMAIALPSGRRSAGLTNALR